MSFEPLFDSYVNIIGNVLKTRIKISKFRFLGIEFSFEGETGSIDDRLKKIDLAKKNLQEGLSAIEELGKEAKKNKLEVQKALSKIQKLTNDKQGLEDELKSIKEVISTDVDTFKKIAGIPSDVEIRKERFFGFISGVLASVIASGIVALIVVVFNNWNAIIEFFNN